MQDDYTTSFVWELDSILDVFRRYNEAVDTELSNIKYSSKDGVNATFYLLDQRDRDVVGEDPSDVSKEVKDD